MQKSRKDINELLDMDKDQEDYVNTLKTDETLMKELEELKSLTI